MRMRTLLIGFGIISLAACATVRQSDVDAWAGQPVDVLDRHPLFLTMKLEKSYAEDGTEIRNYVNSRVNTSCVGLAFCTSQQMACNNIFYIKDGHVIRYAPTPSGGARCFTDDQVLPRNS
ncbi:hypothetical protein [Beijerinckia indica]|uniref:Lipoprotein n=1 Tax=Beijerinckia indica subsp. indica (strain ATCC 9039 / DSM 1715 / NCIMB 8712) TaxID=395963 RepID=B2IFP9_BEII9|nr:hypothetical protein [Beijerinckia indica]ACB94260.1 hypothetical protein Bind_0610 [Beijerinckia indica subsp. indica ATCC 9039]